MMRFRERADVPSAVLVPNAEKDREADQKRKSYLGPFPQPRLLPHRTSMFTGCIKPALWHKVVLAGRNVVWFRRREALVRIRHITRKAVEEFLAPRRRVVGHSSLCLLGVVRLHPVLDAAIPQLCIGVPPCSLGRLHLDRARNRGVDALAACRSQAEVFEKIDRAPILALNILSAQAHRVRVFVIQHARGKERQAEVLHRNFRTRMELATFSGPQLGVGRSAERRFSGY